MELHDFLAKYYELFAELETNKAQFSEEFYTLARKLLLKQFDRATETFLLEQELEFADKNFRLRFDVSNRTPRRHFFFWWNAKAKLLLKQYRTELEEYLRDLESGINDFKESVVGQGTNLTEQDANKAKEGNRMDKPG